MTLNYLLFISLYFLILLIIGYVSRKNDSLIDFLLGKRELGILSTTSTLIASFVGGGVLVVYTAFIFDFGLGIMSAFLGLAFGYFLLFFSAKKVRSKAKSKNYLTINDIFLNEKSKGITIISVIVFLYAMLITLNQFVAGSQIISTVSNFTYFQALFCIIIIILIYLCLGGFKSVVRTDIFQFILIMSLLILLSFNMKQIVNLPIESFLSNSTPFILILVFFIYGILIIWHQPDIWQRVYAIKDEKTLRISFILVSILLLLIGFCLMGVGLSAKLHSPDISSDTAIIHGLQNMVSPEMAILGIILMLAAIMSSADSFLFVLASNLVKDFIIPLNKKKISDKNIIKISRLMIFVSSILIFILAYFFRDLVYIATLNIGIGVALTPAIIARINFNIKYEVLRDSIVIGIIYVIILALLDKVTPEWMLSTFFISTIFLFISKKLRN